MAPQCTLAGMGNLGRGVIWSGQYQFVKRYVIDIEWACSSLERSYIILESHGLICKDLLIVCVNISLSLNFRVNEMMTVTKTTKVLSGNCTKKLLLP